MLDMCLFFIKQRRTKSEKRRLNGTHEGVAFSFTRFDVLRVRDRIESVFIYTEHTFVNSQFLLQVVC